MKYAIALVTPILVLLCGCSTTPKHTETGFLSNYSNLQLSNEYPDARIYVSPAFSKDDFAKIKKIYIAPFEVWLSQDAMAFLGSQHISQSSQYFYNALANKLGDDFQIVSDMGPETLGVRGAFTDVKLNSPSISPTDILPFKVVMNAGNLAYLEATGQQDLVTQVGIEVEFSMTSLNNIVFAMTSVKTLDTTVDKGVDGNIQAMKLVIDKWVDNFAKALNNAKKNK